VITPQGRRSWKRREEKLRGSGWIVRAWTAARARSCPSSGSRSSARSNSTARAGTGTTGSSAAGACARTLHRSSRRRCSRSNWLYNWFLFWSRSRLGGWRDRGRWWRDECRSVRRGGPKLDVLEPLSRCAVACPRASSASAGGTRTTSTDGGLSLEVVLRCGIQDQENDERMSKKRGSGALPPPLSLARYSDRRPIPSFYVDG